MANVIIAEGVAAVAEVIGRVLSDEGHSCSYASDGASAVDEMLAGNGDLVLIDTALDGLSGFHVLEYARLRDIPALMVVPSDRAEDCARALYEGADDCIVRPFSLRELMARVDSLLRSRGLHVEKISVGRAEIDLRARRARVAGREVELSPREYGLLAFFSSNAGRALSRETIYERVWRAPFPPGGTKAVDAAVARLRRKLGDDGVIKSIRKYGYRFDPDLGAPSEKVKEKSRRGTAL